MDKDRKSKHELDLRDKIKHGTIACLLVLVWVLITILIIKISTKDEKKGNNTEKISTTEQKIVREDLETTEAKTTATTDTESTTELTTESKEEEFDPTILVNANNILPENYYVPITKLANGEAVNSYCYDDLQAMMDACRAAGCNPFICSSYREYKLQVKLFDEEIEKYKKRGYSEEEAREKAGEMLAIPGTSEHELGLALDIVDASYQILDEKQESTKTQKWLMENCYDYGFILRYPRDTMEITGIGYEPWHYRYVGKEAAAYIKEHKITLEEYKKEH